jgi:hypothetical protein
MSREAAVAATPEPEPQPETAQERATPLRQHPVTIGDGDGGSGSGGGCASTVVGGWSPRQWPASPRWTRRAAAPTAITRSPTWRGTDAEAQRILDSISSSSSSDDNDDGEQESGGHPGSLSALVSELLVGHPSRSSPVQRSPVRVRVRARRLGGSAGGEEGVRMGAAPPEAWMYARARGARRKQSRQPPQQQPPPPPPPPPQQQRQPQQRRQQQRQQLLQQWQRQEEEERARHVVARVEGAGLTVASADIRTSPIVRPRVRARRVSGPRTHSGSSPDTARSRSPTTRQNEAAVEIFVESECAQRSF